MAVDAVNSVNFQGRKGSYTKNGNEYNKTHAGRYVGMGVGALVGAGYPLYILREVQKDKPFFKKVLVRCRQEFKNGLAQSGVDVSNLKMSAKSVSKVLKGIPVVTGAITLLVGLGVGAIVDGIINHVRAKKADKAA